MHRIILFHCNKAYDDYFPLAYHSMSGSLSISLYAIYLDKTVVKMYLFSSLVKPLGY